MTIIEQLRILSIFHYVVGGLHALFGSFGLIHFFIGISFLLNPNSDFGPGPGLEPQLFGALFAIVGGVFVFCGWTIGFLTILSGRYIAKRTRRTFSVVIGAINCALFPFGTVLGVFDILLLTKDETTNLYKAQQGA